MFEGFKPTKAEMQAIDRGFRVLCNHARSEFEVTRWAREEARGYGNAHDKIPLMAARGLLCKWFQDGIVKTDALLRDRYYCRPAAIWATGLGADKMHLGQIEADDAIEIAAACDAYEAAFKRMQQANMGANAQ